MAKELELLDEGSWALMIEESNIKALQKYHGSMAKLNICYYLSVGTNRYYKSYFQKENILDNRKRIEDFLLDEKKYNSCIFEIHNILDKMANVSEYYQNLQLIDKYNLYCHLLVEYIAYYNSVISDTFYQDIYDMVDSLIPNELSFASKQMKDSLFATNNNELLTHTYSVDLLAITQKYLNGQETAEDIANYVEKYRSTTTSSGNPEGITAEEVMNSLQQQTAESAELEKVFLENLNFRYSHSEKWSEMTADTLNLSTETRKLIRRTSHLSYFKILMREAFQNFKIVTRKDFLYSLIDQIGKSQFDYMRINEICDFIQHGKRVDPSTLSKRKQSVVFEMDEDKINFLDVVPIYVQIKNDYKEDHLTGDVLIGTGCKRYKVKKIEQDEAGLNDFNEFIEKTEDKENVAIITNVLRPFLVPKLKNFGVLITQYGGYTSHASVLCRELGINSMISVNGLMSSLASNNFIEVDFTNGVIKNSTEAKEMQSENKDVIINLDHEANYSKSEVGNKAANLLKINQTANIAKGFVITNYALRNLCEENVQKEIISEIDALSCLKIVIRSSHENEDGNNTSCAGLFESYVNADASDKEQIIELIKSVYESKDNVSVTQYADIQEGNMFVIIQEMITADISGVMLTSNPYNGLDYMLIEYTVGDLCYLMQGDITPLVSYIKKLDIINQKEDYSAYPSIINPSLMKSFYELSKTAVRLESLFSHRLEIEWGIKDGKIYIFQARNYS